jgi:hypothetical protein
VPLPFLTADRAFDEAAQDVALPFDDRDRWRRPYRPGPWRVGAAALVLLLASYVLVAAVIIAVAGTLPGAGACMAAATVVIACALRLLRMGVGSVPGAAPGGFFVTRTTPWEQVVAVRTVQQPVRWLGLPRTVQGQALTLVRADRATGDEPPLMTTHNADFLARTEAFDRAADVVEVWADEYRRV